MIFRFVKRYAILAIFTDLLIVTANTHADTNTQTIVFESELKQGVMEVQKSANYTALIESNVSTPLAMPFEDTRQYETIGDFPINGQFLVDNKAFYTWYAVSQLVLLDSSNANDGDTVVWRWTFPSGYIEQTRYVTWVQSGNCWQPSWDATCQNYGLTNIASNPQQNVGPWQFDLVVNKSAVSTYKYHVIGHTMTTQGGSSFSGQVGTTVKQPLRVRLVDYDGKSGVGGKLVNFSMASSGGSGLVANYTNPPSGNGANSLSVLTDANGIAEVYVELGGVEEILIINTSSSSAPLNPGFFDATPQFTVTSVLGPPVPDYEVTELEKEKNLGEIDKGGCAGNPINTITGNKLQKESDFSGLSASALEFSRFYNAHDLTATILGKGWHHSFQRDITFTKEGKGQSAISYAALGRADGQTVVLSDTGAGWVGDADEYYQLIKKGGKWELYTAKDTVEVYDGKGKLLSITDRQGNTQTLSYDNKKRLARVITNSNEELIFTYDAFGRILNVDYWASNPDPVAGQSRQWTYGYTDDNLTSVTNPDGTQRLYHYEDIYNPWSLTGITDERGIRYATWSYDLFGYATSSYHGIDAERVDINYGLNGLRTVTDSLGNATDYGVMAQLGTGILTDREGPACTTGDTSLREYSYDPLTNNKISQTIDGTTTQYGNYDANGNPGYQIEAVGTPSVRRTDYTYDSRFHSKITSITEPSVHAGENKVTTMVYDEFGNLIDRTVDGFKPDGTPITRTITFEYNGPYNQLSQIDGPRTDVTDITTFEYYADDPGLYQHQGMLRKVTGPEGIVLRDNLQYNIHRHLVSETRPNGLVVTYDWELDTGRMASLTETVGAENRTTSWTYLPTGEIETTTQADGSTLTFEYDEARRLVRITDSLGNYIAYNLDTEGDILNESTYDPNNALTKSITRTFDVYNRLDVMTQANESLDFDYAADGTLAREVNGNAVETQYSYDDLKRLTTTLGDAVGTDPDTAVSQTDLDYDSQDNLAAVTDPLTSLTTYTYDDLGNRVSLVSPDTGTSTFAYDSAGNRIQSTDAKGQIFTFSYDARNRQTFADAPGSDHDIQYTYDSCTNGADKLCSLARGSNTTQYTYNGFGDVVAMEQDVQTATALVSPSLGLTYDAAGRMQSITYPGNTRVSYGYDAMGNVNQLTLDRNGLVTELISNVVYEPFGPLKALNLGNGLARSIDHDQAYRITAINDPVYDATLSYDANGNILYQSRNVGDLSTGYDALDKLTTATGALDSHAYAYDRNANRLSDTLNGTATAYDYEPFSNRLSQVGIGPVFLDANGNTTLLRGMSLDYSPDNRLIAANNANYGYNGFGERVLKENAIATTVYLYDLQGQLVAELDGSGHVEKAYVYLNGQPFAVVDYSNGSTGELTYIHTDHLGTPQGLTNESGNVVWLADYPPFGLAVVNEDPDLDGNAVTLNLRFPGQYYDQETELHYNYFRDYDPSTGRYIQSDPIGLNGGLNTYGYVGGNPINRYDSLGLYYMGAPLNAQEAREMYPGTRTLSACERCKIKAQATYCPFTGFGLGRLGFIAGGAIGSAAPGLGTAAGATAGAVTGFAVGTYVCQQIKNSACAKKCDEDECD